MVFTAKRLAIVGHRGEPVPNELLHQQGGSDHLAVLLPGLGYTCDMPLFYYAESMLLDAGAGVLRVEYAYRLHHSLDVPGDPVASAAAVGQVVAAMRTFFATE